MPNQNNLLDNYQTALAYHKRLPDRIREYIHERGIPDPVICRFVIGWDGNHITFPITNKQRKVVFFMLAKDPENTSNSPLLLSSQRTEQHELFGWERIVYKQQRIVICEDEWERLILESHGIPAICSTAGSLVFLPEWADALHDTPEVYICFRNRADGYDTAGGVAGLIPGSKIVQLPEEVGLGGTLEDYFIRLGRSRDDFNELLARASLDPRSA